MIMTQDIQDAVIVEKKQSGRKGDGGTYLVVADDSDEFRTALKYACDIAKTHRGRIGILHIMEDQDFQHWGAVEKKVKREMREQGERYLWAITKLANDYNGTIPSLYFAEGDMGDSLIKTIDEDEHITQLILGQRSSGGAGPIVSFALGKGLSRLRVPVVIVPSHLKS
jgi:nucleotide-binding universal stress UspA family protein